MGFDPDTFEPTMETDYSQKNYMYSLTRGWEYKFLGMNLNIHLFSTKEDSKIFL